MEPIRSSRSFDICTRDGCVSESGLERCEDRVCADAGVMNAAQLIRAIATNVERISVRVASEREGIKFMRLGLENIGYWDVTTVGITLYDIQEVC